MKDIKYEYYLKIFPPSDLYQHHKFNYDLYRGNSKELKIFDKDNRCWKYSIMYDSIWQMLNTNEYYNKNRGANVPVPIIKIKEFSNLKCWQVNDILKDSNYFNKYLLIGNLL